MCIKSLTVLLLPLLVAASANSARRSPPSPRQWIQTAAHSSSLTRRPLLMRRFTLFFGSVYSCETFCSLLALLLKDCVIAEPDSNERILSKASGQASVCNTYHVSLAPHRVATMTLPST